MILFVALLWVVYQLYKFMAICLIALIRLVIALYKHFA